MKVALMVASTKSGSLLGRVDLRQALIESRGKNQCPTTNY